MSAYDPTSSAQVIGVDFSRMFLDISDEITPNDSSIDHFHALSMWLELICLKALSLGLSYPAY
jgi:hypothetical protein